MWSTILKSVKEELFTSGHIDNLAPMSSRGSGKEVHSECISSVSYDSESGDMTLKFVKGKKTYTYPDVSTTTFLQFMSAPSKGHAYWEMFRLK